MANIDMCTSMLLKRDLYRPLKVSQCYECPVFHLLLRGRALCLLVCVKLFTLFVVNEYLTPVFILALINI